MKQGKGKLSKARLAAVVTAAAVAAALAVLLVVNIFVPVKYLTAYVVKERFNAAGNLRVTFLNVGYGDCILAELPDGKTLLIDGGDGEYFTRLGVLKALNARGVDRIDYLVCSSVQGEHCGGLTELLRYKQVGRAFVPYCNNRRITPEYRAFMRALEEEEIPTGIACYGEGGVAEGYDCFFTFLSPSAYGNPNGGYAQLNQSNTRENILNASAVVWLQYGDTAFAFASDAGRAALKGMTDDYLACRALGQKYAPYGGYRVELEQCDVLSVAGHGNEDCTYAPWYAATVPECAVISVGENFANCPSAQALADVTNYVPSPHITKEAGEITFISDGTGYKISLDK